MKNKKLKVLGSVSPYCKDNSNCPGYMFLDGEDKILLDCGSGICGMLKMPEDLNNLTIIISHFHKDHYVDLFSLGYASFCYNRMGKLKNKINVYIPKMQVDEDGYDDFNLVMNSKTNYFNINTYDENTKMDIGGKTISFFKNHHSIKSFSTMIQNDEFKLVYTGDMGFKKTKEFSEFCKNADLLICESTYLESDNVVDENHLHAIEAGKIADMSNVKTLILTHFWPEHDSEEYVNEAKQVFENIICAREGLIINI